MHFEVLVEDQSGKAMLEILFPKIIGPNHTFKVIDYKGIGRIPQNLQSGTDTSHRFLLEQLPRLLRAYGKTFAEYGKANYQAAVIVVCDLDDKCLKLFRQELLSILAACPQAPETRFCIAVEEGEAWLLGDLPAVTGTYPQARQTVLRQYKNDSICNTWECLADAVYPGGHEALKKQGWRTVGEQKSIWAKSIAPRMDIGNNQSPSFRHLCDKIQDLAQTRGNVENE